MEPTEGHKHWNEVDHSLTSNLLGKISHIVECAICSEIMIIPMTAECGHSFCYGCIFHWFGTKLNCPTCRKTLETKPVLNIQLKEISKNMTDLLIETITDTKEKEHLINHRDESSKLYDTDKSKDGLFGNLFSGTTMLIDNSDGVPRCANCHWEAHGNVCMHCGTRFRNVTNLVDGDFDGDSSDEDYFDGASPDVYDLDDGFVDDEEIGAMYRGLVDDFASELDVEGDSDEDNWFGFQSDDNVSLSGVDEDDLSPSVIESMHDMYPNNNHRERGNSDNEEFYDNENYHEGDDYDGDAYEEYETGYDDDRESW